MVKEVLDDMKKYWVVFSLLLFMIIPIQAKALNEVNIYFFYSNSCDFCKQEEVYLEALKQRYPNMRIYSYEISDSSKNDLMITAKNMYQVTQTGVPFTVIGDTAYSGFSQSKKALFQKAVYEYSTKSYQNRLGNQLGISYRNDLEGTVEEYKNNDSYQIEESSGIERQKTPIKESNYDKYKVSFYLVIAGFLLSCIALVLFILERRR